MKTLTKRVILDFVPVLMVSLFFFVLILQLLDIFSNLWKYLNNGVELRVIMRISLLYIPKCLSYVLPVGVLFSVSYILGNYFQNNELIAILNSGISLRQFVLPLLTLGLLLSIGSFFFEDRVVIPSFREKRALTMESIGQAENFNNSQVTLISGPERIVYHADFYNDAQKSLSRPIIIMRSENGDLLQRIDGDSARWQEDRWVFRRVRIYENFHENPPTMVEHESYEHEKLNEPPETFRRQERDVAEMTLSEAKIWIESLKKAGLPYRKEMTDYYSKFSFPMTIWIVTLISCALGSRFEKNILLMSLLLSLGLAVGYYILTMVMSLMSTYGYIPPITGAWLGFFLFLALGIYLFNKARS